MNKETHAQIKQSIHDLNVEISHLSAKACTEEDISYEEAKMTITNKIFHYIFIKINPKTAKETNHADALFGKI